VIVFASFMCNLIVDGIANSFGVFLPKYVAAFDVGKGDAAWAGSLLCGVYLCVGKWWWWWFGDIHLVELYI